LFILVFAIEKKSYTQQRAEQTRPEKKAVRGNFWTNWPFEPTGIVASIVVSLFGK